MMATLFGTEITNPLLQLRFFLRYGTPANPIILGFVDWSFLLLFTLMRIILGSMLLYRYMMHPRPDFVARFFACAIYVISWIFWLHIMRYAFRKYVLRLLFGKRKPSTGEHVDDNGHAVNSTVSKNNVERPNAVGDVVGVGKTVNNCK